MTALASDYGSETNTFNGMLLNLSARPRNGLVFQGGVSTGKTNMDYCSVRNVLPEALNISAGPAPVSTDPYCNSTTGWITRYTGLGSYTLPKVDVLHLRHLQKRPGCPARGELGGVERRDSAGRSAGRSRTLRPTRRST